MAKKILTVGVEGGAGRKVVKIERVAESFRAGEKEFLALKNKLGGNDLFSMTPDEVLARGLTTREIEVLTMAYEAEFPLR